MTPESPVLERACAAGNLEDCFRLGRYLEATLEDRARSQPELRRAAAAYQRACDGSFGRACTALAALYARGKGVTADVPRAIALLERACDGGDGEGCMHFASALRDPPLDLEVSIEELVLRGLLEAPTGYVALAETDDPLPVLLVVGQRLRDGVVTAIDSSAVTFRQDVPDPLSPVRTREIRMDLYHETASPPPALGPSFQGTRLTLSLQQRPLAEVLAAIARSAGLAVDLERGLDAPVSLEAADKPWDELLHALATEHGLAYVHAGRQVRVGRSLAPRADRRFTGQPITLDLAGVDLDELLRLFADISGLNVLAPAQRHERVAGRLVDVPWDHALDLILAACDLDWRLDGNVLHVLPRDSARLAAAPSPRRGPPIDIRVRDVELGHLFLLLGRATGLDLIAEAAVQGKVSLDLHDVPWDQLVDLVLDRQGLAVVAEGGTLRAVPRADAGEGAHAATALATALAHVPSPVPVESATLGGHAASGRALVRARLQTIRRVLPDTPDPERGASELRALWEESARTRDGPAPPLELNIGTPVAAPTGHYVPVEARASAPLSSVIDFLERLKGSVRLMDLAALKLSRADDRAVRCDATLWLRYQPSTGDPATTLASKVQAIARTTGDALLFVTRLQQAASRARVLFDEASLKQDGGLLRATVRGTVGWPDGAPDVEGDLTAGHFQVQRSSYQAEGPCTRFELTLIGTTDRRDESMSPWRSDRTVAGFGSPDELCRVDRDAQSGPVIRASGRGPLTLRLRDVDLADVVRVLHAQTGQPFVVDEDVVGRVDVDLRSVTAEEALSALGKAGLRTAMVGPLRRVSVRESPQAALGPPDDAPDALFGAAEPTAPTLDFKRRRLHELIADLHFFSDMEVRAPDAPLGRMSVMVTGTPWHEVYPALMRAAGLRLRREEGRLVVEGPAGGFRRIGYELEIRSDKDPSLSLAEFELSGIVSLGEGWSAVAYDPTGRFSFYRKDDRLRDGRVAEVGPAHVVILEKPSPSGAGPLVLRYELPSVPPPITLAADTTRSVAPLLSDGTPDYAAVLNARFGAGVTPENNAAPDLMTVMGVQLPEASQRRLGFGPSASQERFVGGLDPHSFAAYAMKLEAADPGRPLPAHSHFQEEWRRASRGPWSENECPLVAEWLRVNDEALRRIEQAVRKPRFWLPLDEGRSLGELRLHSSVGFRNVANALLARTMLRLGKGDIEGAAADVRAIHRVAGLLAQGPWLIDALIAVAIRGIGSAPVPLLATRLEPAQARSLAAALQDQPALRSLSDAAATTERLSALGTLLWLRRVGAERGPGAWKSHLDPFDADQPSPFYETPVQAYDWDEALRLTNRWHDLMGSGLGTDSPRERERVEALLNNDLDRLRQELEAEMGQKAGAAAFGLKDHFLSRPETREPVRLPQDPAAGVRKVLGRLLTASFVSPFLLRANVSGNEAQAQLRIGVAALALWAHRRETGAFPAAPGDLPFVLADTHDGYVFGYETDPARTRFAYTAAPEYPGHSGFRTFCADDAGRSVAVQPGTEPLLAEGRCRDPEEEKAKSKAAELLEKAEAMVREADTVAVKLGDFQREVQVVEAKLETLRRILPWSPDVPNFLDQLRYGASGSGVRIEWSGGSESESIEGYDRIEIPVRLTGPADAIEAYLPRIDRMARLARVAARTPIDGGAELKLHVFAVRYAPQPPPSCWTLESGASLMACCRTARFDLVPELRDRLGRSCGRLGELQTLLKQMDALAEKREQVSRRVMLIEKLSATPTR